MTAFVLEPLNPLGKAGLGWIRCAMLVNTCPWSSLPPIQTLQVFLFVPFLVITNVPKIRKP